MANKMLNTTYDFELESGEVVKLTLSFYALYQLRSKNKALHDRYNKIMTNNAKNGTVDELDTITILYVAYVCANMANEELMNEEEFMIQCGSDRVAVNKAIEHLIMPKKA